MAHTVEKCILGKLSLVIIENYIEKEYDTYPKEFNKLFEREWVELLQTDGFEYLKKNAEEIKPLLKSKSMSFIDTIIRMFPDGRNTKLVVQVGGAGELVNFQEGDDKVVSIWNSIKKYVKNNKFKTMGFIVFIWKFLTVASAICTFINILNKPIHQTNTAELNVVKDLTNEDSALILFKRKISIDPPLTNNLGLITLKDYLFDFEKSLAKGGARLQEKIMDYIQEELDNFKGNTKDAIIELNKEVLQKLYTKWELSDKRIEEFEELPMYKKILDLNQKFSEKDIMAKIRDLNALMRGSVAGDAVHDVIREFRRAFRDRSKKFTREKEDLQTQLYDYTEDLIETHYRELRNSYHDLISGIQWLFGIIAAYYTFEAGRNMGVNEEREERQTRLREWAKENHDNILPPQIITRQTSHRDERAQNRELKRLTSEMEFSGVGKKKTRRKNNNSKNKKKYQRVKNQKQKNESKTKNLRSQKKQKNDTANIKKIINHIKIKLENEILNSYIELLYNLKPIIWIKLY